MKIVDAMAEILKREGVEVIFGYPLNPILDAAAKRDIRPIIVRQERTGVHMADALSRLTSGERLGVFTMQTGPGVENSFGGVAQAFSDSVPLILLPIGAPRELANTPPNFSALLKATASLPLQCRHHFWHRLQLFDNRLRDGDASGEAHNSCDTRCDGS